MTKKEAITDFKYQIRLLKENDSKDYDEMIERNLMAIRSLEAWDKVLDEFASAVPRCIMTNEDAAYLNGLAKGYEIVAKYLKEVEE